MKKSKMINFGKLKERCLSPIHKFRKEGRVFFEGSDKEHIFIDRGSSILAVAHLDTVNNLDHFYTLRIGGDLCVMAGQLDDRLGAYVILDVLPRLGILPDILLTIGEETGQSSGEFFESPRQYNWMFSFDRHGTDVVSYQYQDTNMTGRLKDAGFTNGIGSFSDISCMGHLKCAGMNFGVGYRDEHFATAHVFVEDTITMVNRFRPFYFQHKDSLFHYEPTIRQPGYWYGWNGRADYGSGYDDETIRWLDGDDGGEDRRIRQIPPRSVVHVPIVPSNGKVAPNDLITLSYEEIEVLSTLLALGDVSFPLEVIPSGTEYSSISIALFVEMLDSESVKDVDRLAVDYQDELYDMSISDVLESNYMKTAAWMLDNIHFPATGSRLNDYLAQIQPAIQNTLEIDYSKQKGN